MEHKETFSKRLNRLMADREIRPAELARLTGISRALISRYIRGMFVPKQDNTHKIAIALNVDPGYLMTGVKQKTAEEVEKAERLKKSLPAGAFVPAYQSVPMLGYAAAGSPLEDINQDTAYVNIAGKYDVDFCITVRGDSMTGLGINNGDIIFVKAMPEVANGQVAVVEINNEKVCLKRFYKAAGVVTLVSENPKYAPIVLTPDNCENVRILGRAVLKQSIIV